MPSVRPLQRDDDVAYYTTLLETADLVVDHRDIAELLPELGQRLKQDIPFDILILSLYDPARDMMRAHIWRTGGLSDESPELPTGDTPAGFASANQLPVLIPDVSKDRRFPDAS
jgi:hypothetical protein